MPTTSKARKSSKTRKTVSSRKAPAKQDALSLLKEDHEKAKKLFKQFERMKKKDASDEELEQIVEQACKELTIHTQIEEQIFYPALRAAIDDDDLMDEATVEHQSAKDLIAQLQDPGADLHDAKFTVLGEYVNHHIEEEEKEMFKKARRAKIDLVALGERMAAMKTDLLGDSDTLENEPMRTAPMRRAASKAGAGARR